jgi:hypothetical protein
VISWWIPGEVRPVTWREGRDRLAMRSRQLLGPLLVQPPGLSPTPEVPDDHHDPVRCLVPTAPAFTNAERLALAGFLAADSGLTRQAYELDLRQYASWCR